MKNDIKSYERLWTTDREEFVLVNLNEKSPLDECLIFHVNQQSALVIEDDDLRQEVVRRMIASGVKIVNELP